MRGLGRPVSIATLAFWVVACGGERGALGTPSGAPATGETAKPAVKKKVVEVGPMPIDQIYRSMDGPFARTRFDFSDMDWITAFKSEVLDAATGERIGDEFFCHSQMQLDNETRLLVTATGITEIRFPEGYGMPLKYIMEGVPPQWRGVTLFGMVLNNHQNRIAREAKVRLSVDYMSFPGGEIPPGYKKIYKVELPMTLEAATAGEHDHAGHDHAAHGHGHDHGDGLVQGLKQHWYVPPGRQVLTRKLDGIVPVESTVHYAVVHMHNYGVSMKLRDVTANQVLWETRVENEPDRVQIARIPAYESATGFRIYPDHVYEIESVYDNTTNRPVDAMAMMYLYYHPLGNEDITYPAPPRGDPNS